MDCIKEEDFIHEGLKNSPSIYLKWLLLVIFCTATLGSALIFYGMTLDNQISSKPFLKVTNREISLFLWQNPSLMRSWAKNKNSYLPGFEYSEKIGLNPEYAEEYASAPPDVLFLYHTWKRLIAENFPKRTVSKEEFQTFLLDLPEWHPKNWSKAPAHYKDMVYSLESLNDIHSLPNSVLQAFIGWKNFFVEGNAINEKSFSKAEVDEFLKYYPNYSRNFWVNIAGKSYLESLQKLPTSAKIPNTEIPGFLRVALYNFYAES